MCNYVTKYHKDVCESERTEKRCSEKCAVDNFLVPQSHEVLTTGFPDMGNQKPKLEVNQAAGGRMTNLNLSLVHINSPQLSTENSSTS